jgi:hypothetical protein
MSSSVAKTKKTEPVYILIVGNRPISSTALIAANPASFCYERQTVASFKSNVRGHEVRSKKFLDLAAVKSASVN